MLLEIAESKILKVAGSKGPLQTNVAKRFASPFESSYESLFV